MSEKLIARKLSGLSIVIALLLSLLIPILLVSQTEFVSASGPTWWDNNWTRRRSITISVKEAVEKGLRLMKERAPSF